MTRTIFVVNYTMILPVGGLPVTTEFPTAQGAQSFVNNLIAQGDVKNIRLTRQRALL